MFCGVLLILKTFSYLDFGEPGDYTKPASTNGELLCDDSATLSFAWILGGTRFLHHSQILRKGCLKEYWNTAHVEHTL